jgi:hypothetical protein
MKNLTELSDYSGIDVSNEISLFEYGILAKETGENDELHVWYGIESDESGDYTKFDHGYITKSNINSLLDESWFDKDSFLSFIGMTEKDWKSDEHYISKLHDLFQYYGYENIMGSCYYPIEITNE